MIAIGALVVFGAAYGAAAPKSSKPSASSLSGQIAAQKKQIDAQQVTIDTQHALISAQRAVTDSQSVQLQAQEARLADLEAQLAQMKERLVTLESQANVPSLEDSLSKRLAKVEAESKKAPELPPDVVSAGYFPGSIRIPGTDAAIKFGGLIRTAVVLTLNPLGTDDRFLTNSIPVGTQSVGEARRTNISARASRLNIEFRTPQGRDELRTYFEGDFAGAGSTNSFRLRHAYAQYLGFIIGQTWSTFADPSIEPGDLDFEGLSAQNLIRQPQVRYWWSPRPENRAAVSAETPEVDITGGTGVNLFPDIVARDFIGYTDGTHLQIAGVLRQIRGQTAAGDVRSTWGAGGSVSGIKLIKVKGLTDRFMFQVNGGLGIARYINDLNSLGGQDAVFDTTTGDLKPLPVLGWYVGFEHRWKEWEAFQTMNLRTTLLWSFVVEDNYDFQPPDAYWRTQRFSANVVFSPTARADFGIEYIYGSRENKDTQSASANQFQAVALFRF